MEGYLFKLPDLGEGAAEAEIAAWHVAVGDTVAEDQPLVDVLTDKATIEIPSPVAGTVVSLYGEPGEKRAVGSDLVRFDVRSDREIPASHVVDRPNMSERERDALLSMGGVIDIYNVHQVLGILTKKSYRRRCELASVWETLTEKQKKSVEKIRRLCLAACNDSQRSAQVRRDRTDDTLKPDRAYSGAIRPARVDVED